MWVERPSCASRCREKGASSDGEVRRETERRVERKRRPWKGPRGASRCRETCVERGTDARREARMCVERRKAKIERCKRAEKGIE